MQRVVSINLNGNAYQLDENAYNALFAYLDTAETQLKDNPDRAEIMADLEQAVAEKCSTYLGPHKTVVTAAEVDRIIAQMGPVDGDSHAQGVPGADQAKSSSGNGEAAGTSAEAKPGAKEQDGARSDTRSTTRRLYQISEGSMIGGVCNGIAAYFAIDVTLVRIIFVLLAIVTQGAWIAAYLGMMWLIPRASTPDQRAAAHGMHFSAQDVVDQAKKNIEEFSKDFSKHDWMPYWRQRREWRRHYRSTMWNPPPPPPGFGGRPGLGPLFGVVSMGLFITLIVAVASIFGSGLVFGWPFFPGPRWISIVLVIGLLQLLAMPLRIAFRTSHPYYGWYWMAHPILWLGLMIVGLWFADQYIPGVHAFINNVNFGWETAR